MEERQIIEALGALAQEHRLRIFRLLVVQGPAGMPAGDIARATRIGATNVSFHLKELERAGLLRSARQGRFIRYAIDIDGIRELLAYLTEECCQGRPELCGDLFARASRRCRPERVERSPIRSRGREE
jgi:ArsR family transcriptional regulator